MEILERWGSAFEVGSRHFSFEVGGLNCNILGEEVRILGEGVQFFF